MRELPGYRHQAKGPVAATLPEAMERAKAACARSWERRDEPCERYTITFKSGWGPCGDVMSAFESMGLRTESWDHDYPFHAVTFACPYDALDAAKLAVKGCRVGDTRCRLVAGS